jgi:predicted ArsR family transcriptional regulator
MPRSDGRATRNGGSNPRVLASTRGKLLADLCRGPKTVTDLATALSVTDNAVRAQLQRLVRDGLVRRAGSRRGVRRPHASYEITVKGRAIFPRGYEPILRKLVDVLFERMPASDVQTLFNEVGRHILRERLGEMRGRIPRQRLREIIKHVSALAGFEVEQERGTTLIQACSCPLGSVTAARPELCGMAGRLISQVLQADVRETCERGEWPQCRFEVRPTS